MAEQKPFVRNSSIPLAETQFEPDGTRVSNPIAYKGPLYKDPAKVVVKRWANGEYRNNPGGGTSTHIMTDFEADGKYYAAPTLYPKSRKGTKSNDPKDWYEAPKKGFAFADTAQARGEMYGPFRSQKIASDFAKNGYKNQPNQKAALKKLKSKKK
jgi:hypothetical protein